MRESQVGRRQLLRDALTATAGLALGRLHSVIDITSPRMDQSGRDAARPSHLITDRTMRGSKAWISGCSGQRLTADERAFFADERPWGFILFGRNISVPNQVRDLVAELKEADGRDAVPVLIDQEGGRVQRLRPPFAQRFPPASEIGRVHAVSREDGLRAAWLQGRLLAADLMDGYGINVNCIPCLDVPSPGSHSIIGDRAYAADPDIVAELGRAAAEGSAAGGVLPVMKHMPGHGRAKADSHLELPSVSASLDELVRHDFRPFAALNDLPAAMSAHILFEAIDPERPATLSPIVIQTIIRERLGFDGLLMTDDMSMKALQGDMRDLAGGAIRAGCDIALHCNGDLAEMRAVAAAVPELAGASLKRADDALQVVRRPSERADIDSLRAEFTSLLGNVA